MRQRSKPRKITIVFALVILAAAAFAMSGAFPNTASAPFISSGAGHAREEDPAATDAASAQPGASASADSSVSPEVTPGVKTGAPDNDFLIVRMSVSDISAGDLVLINRDFIYPIPDEDVFTRIAELKTPSYRLADGRMLLAEHVIGPLNDMMDAFLEETGNDTVAVVSAFRNFDEQLDALSEYVTHMGYSEAVRWAAPPGYSEHHAGLAVDLGVYRSGSFRTFRDVGDNAWFLKNSYRFGFIARYPENKTIITDTAAEPWHFRYAGDPHAFIMYENDWCLEEYVQLLMDYSYDDPLSITYNEVEYRIYFTSDIDVPIPFDCDFDISGNNVNGFIVTLKLDPIP